MPSISMLSGIKSENKLKSTLFRLLLLRSPYCMRAGFFCIILSAVLSTLYNIPFWKEVITVQGGVVPQQVLFLIFFVVLITAILNAFLNIFCARFILKPLAISIVISASIALYFIWAYGVMIDRSMIENVIETDIGEIRGLLNPTIFVFILITGLLPTLVIAKIRINYYGFIKQLFLNIINITVSITVSAVIIFSFYADYASISQNHRYLRLLLIPSNYLYSMVTYFSRRSAVTGPLIPIGRDAVRSGSWIARQRKSVIVLVVGETARAKNFGFYGYERNTTPALAARNAISFKEFYSCGTSTAVSLPCMFSILPRAHFKESEALKRENVLDIISRAGIKVVWRDNNSGCKGVCGRVQFEDLSKLTTIDTCNSDECYDEVLLTDLGAMIDRLDRDLFIVLHQKGSHGPAYYKRVPEKFVYFKPVCNDGQLKNCSQQEIINAYDNTIVYTDYVLSQIIDILKSREILYSTALLYVSDHGESLGEKNLYLHGTPYILAPEEQIHIPFLIWLSEGYKSDFGINEQCLRQKADGTYSHDNLFHSLLGMLNIATVDYDKSLDIFTDCLLSHTAN